MQKKIELFYEKYKWKKINNKSFQIIDHKYPKKFSMMCFNQKVKILKDKIEYSIFS